MFSWFCASPVFAEALQGHLSESEHLDEHAARYARD